MANGNSTQPNRNDRLIEFAAAGSPFYQLHAAATTADVHDQLSARLSQLSAMLIMTTGTCFETFSSLNDKIREDYLWACSMLADECLGLAENTSHPQPSDKTAA